MRFYLVKGFCFAENKLYFATLSFHHHHSSFSSSSSSSSQSLITSRTNTEATLRSLNIITIAVIIMTFNDFIIITRIIISITWQCCRCQKRLQSGQELKQFSDLSFVAMSSSGSSGLTPKIIFHILCILVFQSHFPTFRCFHWWYVVMTLTKEI